MLTKQQSRKIYINMCILYTYNLDSFLNSGSEKQGSITNDFHTHYHGLLELSIIEQATGSSVL